MSAELHGGALDTGGGQPSQLLADRQPVNEILRITGEAIR